MRENRIQHGACYGEATYRFYRVAGYGRAFPSRVAERRTVVDRATRCATVGGTLDPCAPVGSWADHGSGRAAIGDWRVEGLLILCIVDWRLGGEGGALLLAACDELSNVVITSEYNFCGE